MQKSVTFEYQAGASLAGVNSYMLWIRVIKLVSDRAPPEVEKVSGIKAELQASERAHKGSFNK